MSPSHFRIHLSTAFAMMVLAGALLLANLQSQQMRVPDKFGGTTEYTSYGWPLSVQRMVTLVDPEEPEFGPLGHGFFWFPIIVNTSVAIALLFFCARLLEKRIRQSEAKT